MGPCLHGILSMGSSAPMAPMLPTPLQWDNIYRFKACSHTREPLIKAMQVEVNSDPIGR